MKLIKINPSKALLTSFNKLPEKLFKIHGDRYDYSKVEYTGVKDKVIIICKEHGEFVTNMDSHIQGSNCPKCVGGVRLTLNEFMNKASSIHENKYNYSKVSYVNNSTKIIITCPEHGDFEQTPALHLRGNGCSKCAGKLITNTKEFIEFGERKFKGVHSYEKSVYIASLAPITITCKVHGDFVITPNSYQTSTYGCVKCSSVAPVEHSVLLERFIKVHNTKFDYSKMIYKKMHSKIQIICNSCLYEFSQTPRNHLNGDGCPNCGGSGGFDKSKKAILYYLSINDGEAYKIGITNNSVKNRFYAHDLKKIKVLKEWCYLFGKDAALEEALILKKYSEYKYTGPYLLSSGNTELFNTDVLGLDTIGK